MSVVEGLRVSDKSSCGNSHNSVLAEDTTPVSLEEVAVRLLANLKVRNHKFHLKFCPDSFVGSKAVDYLIQRHGALVCSRAVLVDLVQRLMQGDDGNNSGNTIDHHLFKHVTYKYNFDNARLFCRFGALPAPVDGAQLLVPCLERGPPPADCG